MSTLSSGRASVPTQATPADVPAPATPPAADRPAGATRTDRVRDAVHVGACMLCGVLVTAGFALDSTSDTDGDAALIAAVTADPGRFYWANTLAAFGLVLLVAVGLAVLRLVRGRGRAVATAGGLLVMIGGAASSAGIFMYGAVVTGMVESGMSSEDAVALQESLGDSARPGLAFLVGFPGFALGLVLCVVALLASRAVPRWVPVVLAAGLVWVVALGESSLSSIGDLLLTAAFVGIGLSLWKSTAPAG